VEGCVLGPCSPTLLPFGRSRCDRPPQGVRQNAGGDLALALEAVRRIDALFEIERSINGHRVERRRAVRQELSAPLIADLERWMRDQRAKLSRGNDLAPAMDYMLKRWRAFTQFLDDGRICLSNNAAERALRGIALGRKSSSFAGSDRGDNELQRCTA
jgi:transposase